MTTRLAVALICLALAVRGAVAWADWRRCRFAVVTHVEGA